MLDRELARTTQERVQLQRDIANLKARAAEPARPPLQQLEARIDSPDLAVRRDILRAVLGASGYILVKGRGHIVFKSAMMGAVVKRKTAA